ncbi:hypothetical protein AAH978_17560 [Streptomyces sp. ZYX-F-203]
MEPGTLVYDPHTRRVGEYRGQVGTCAVLRPVGGGRAWRADPALVREATSQERLHAEVRAANDRSTSGLVTAYPLVSVGPPPEPLSDCAECATLASRRDAARAGGDESAETDADVLLARHHQDRHGEERIWYVPYTIVRDPSAEPEYQASCVSADGTGCGAASGPRPSPDEVEEWQHRHTRETLHTRYRRSFADYAVLDRRPEPGR